MNVLRKKSVEQTLAETEESGRSLKRDLTWWNLAIMGVAVAVGAGIFSIGAQAAAFHAGPAVIISFLIAGVVCGAAVMCYAEFASMIPVAGSAYTFTYTTVGEVVAWVIGWDLILEMLMAGSVVSKYWGIYLNDFFRLVGWNINTNITIGSFNFDFAPIIVVAFFTTLLVCGTKSRTSRRRAHHTENRHRTIRGNRRILLRQSRELHPVHSTERTGNRHRIRLDRNHGTAIMAVGHWHDPQHLRRCRHHLRSRARVFRVPRLRCGRHHLRRNR